MFCATHAPNIGPIAQRATWSMGLIFNDTLVYIWDIALCSSDCQTLLTAASRELISI